jgi:hypothetical protein
MIICAGNLQGVISHIRIATTDKEYDSPECALQILLTDVYA